MDVSEPTAYIDKKSRVSSSSSSSSSSSAAPDALYTLTCKWKKERISIPVYPTTTLGCLKEVLEVATAVPASGQKLVGVSKSVTDDTLISTVTVKKNTFSMIGTPLHSSFKDRELDASVVDDIAADFSYTVEEVTEVATNPKHLKKMEKSIKELKINVINPLREGKKLLVLDLDYTLFDMKSKADNFMQLKRPYTDSFLTAMYTHYDLIIWSQTSWKWLEIKLTELGLLQHPNYKFSFVLDKSCMFRVESMRKGKLRKHAVKCLELIYRNFPQFNAHNTVHVDDVSRNFVMNAQSGFKIVPFKNAHETRATDRELIPIAQYLTLIATTVNDFRTVDHGQWQRYLADHGHKLQAASDQWDAKNN
jgi:ubiquitin-like domain-containing CTD phosphatase 1